MDNVLTLIASPHIGDPAALVAAAGQALRGAGGDIGTPAILSEGRAWDLPFSGIAPDAAAAAVRSALAGQPVDVAAQAAAKRRKKLLVADMDSTIIPVETIDEVAAHAGLKDQVARITDRAMRGEVDFQAALRERAAMLAGLPAAVLEQTFERAVRLSPGARAVVATMRASGAYTALVSGGFTFFTERVRDLAGFDEAQGNVLELSKGKITGNIVGPIINRDGKRAALVNLSRRHQLTMADTLAVGDGANDLPMLRAAGLGVAFHAKPVVAAGAPVRIDHADLTALLYLQGYRDSEIITL